MIISERTLGVVIKVCVYADTPTKKYIRRCKLWNFGLVLF